MALRREGASCPARIDASVAALTEETAADSILDFWLAKGAFVAIEILSCVVLEVLDVEV